MNRSLIFPFPVVQYIPITLNVKKLFSGLDYQAQPWIDAGTVSDGLLGRFEKNTGYRADDFPVSPDEGLLAVSGLQLKEILYRAYYMIMLAEPSAGCFIAGFPLKYFYKTPLLFQARAEDGVLLASCQFKVPAGGSRYLKTGN